MGFCRGCSFVFLRTCLVDTCVCHPCPVKFLYQTILAVKLHSNVVGRMEVTFDWVLKLFQAELADENPNIARVSITLGLLERYFTSKEQCMDPHLLQVS